MFQTHMVKILSISNIHSSIFKWKLQGLLCHKKYFHLQHADQSIESDLKSNNNLPLERKYNLVSPARGFSSSTLRQIVYWD